MCVRRDAQDHCSDILVHGSPVHSSSFIRINTYGGTSTGAGTCCCCPTSNLCLPASSHSELEPKRLSDDCIERRRNSKKISSSKIGRVAT